MLAIPSIQIPTRTDLWRKKSKRKELYQILDAEDVPIWNEVYYELVYEDTINTIDLLYSIEDVLHDKAPGFVRGIEMGFNLFLCRLPNLKRKKLTKALKVAKEVLHQMTIAIRTPTLDEEEREQLIEVYTRVKGTLF
jgi:hypothetical protein